MKEKWENDFDDKFPQATSIETKANGTWSLNYDTREIKQFIRDLLELERRSYEMSESISIAKFTNPPNPV